MVIKIGHQGAGGHVAGNTLEAMAEGIRLGADMVECDVYLTRDNIPILMHDKNLDRTTNGSGLVRSYDLTELKRFLVQDTFEIPTLAEYVEYCEGKSGMVIELKEECVREVLDVVGALASDDLFLISFHKEVIRDLRLYAPDIRAGLLTQSCGQQDFAACLQLGTEYLCPRQDTLIKYEVEEAKKAGLHVFTWTANSKRRIQELMSYGVDGITSDYPDYF